MQIRLFREHKNDAALKCEIQDFPTKAFQLVIGDFLERGSPAPPRGCHRANI